MKNEHILICFNLAIVAVLVKQDKERAKDAVVNHLNIVLQNAKLII